MKSVVTITLDTEVITAIRDRKINISSLINDFLIDYLLIPPKEKTENTEKLMDIIRSLKDRKEKPKPKVSIQL